MSSRNVRIPVKNGNKIDFSSYIAQITAANIANNNKPNQKIKIKPFNKKLNMSNLHRCTSYGINGLSSGSTSIETVGNYKTTKRSTQYANDNHKSLHSNKSRNPLPHIYFTKGINLGHIMSPLADDLYNKRYKRSVSGIFNFNTYNNNYNNNKENPNENGNANSNRNRNKNTNSNGNANESSLSPFRNKISFLPKSLQKNRGDPVARDNLFKINEMKPNAFEETNSMIQFKDKDISSVLALNNNDFIKYYIKKVDSNRNKSRVNADSHEIRKEVDQMKMIKAIKMMKPTISYKHKIQNGLFGNSQINLQKMKKDLCNEMQSKWALSLPYFLNEFDSILYEAQPMPSITTNQIITFHYYIFRTYLCPYNAMIQQMKEEDPIRAQNKIDILQKNTLNKGGKVNNRKRTPIINEKELFINIMSNKMNLAVENKISSNNMVIRDINNIKAYYNNPEDFATLFNKKMKPRLGSKSKLNILITIIDLILKNPNSIKGRRGVLMQKSIFELTGHNCEFNSIPKHSVRSSPSVLSLTENKEKGKLKSILILKGKTGPSPIKENIKSQSPLIEKEAFDQFVDIIKAQNEELFKFSFNKYTSRYDINTSYNKNNTLLNIAVQENQSAIALYLLSKGADPNISNVSYYCL